MPKTTASKSVKPTPTKAPATKLDLGGLGSPAKSGNAEHPVLDDPKGLLGKIGAQIQADRTTVKTLDGQIKANCALLIEQAVPFYFAENSGRNVPLTGVSIEQEIPVEGVKGASKRSTVALVLVNNKYPLVTDDAKKKVKADDVKAAIVDLVGEDFFAAQFEEVAVVSLAVDQVAAASRQAFINELRKLVGKYEANDAVTVKHGFQAKEGFHAARNVDLAPETNVALHTVYPATVAVKTDKLG